jgi:hypothetical protein
MSNIIKHQDQQQELQTLKAMAAIAVNSGKYGGDYNEATILNIFFTAKSLGIDPMVALNGGFNIIKGKINMGAHFMTALARRKGHSIKVIEMTDKKCVIIGQRKDNGDSVKYEYTWEEATRADLTGKPNWKSNPKQMLYCGCVRNVFRILFSDLGIAYDADEMNVEDHVIEEGVHVEVNPPAIAMVAAQEASVEEDDSGFFERLTQELQKDSIGVDHLEDYLTDLSTKKKQPVEQILKAALMPEFIAKFKNAYLKFVEKLQVASQEPLAV